MPRLPDHKGSSERPNQVEATLNGGHENVSRHLEASTADEQVHGGEDSMPDYSDQIDKYDEEQSSESGFFNKASVKRRNAYCSHDY